MRPLGEVVALPFEVGHTVTEPNELAKFILIRVLLQIMCKVQNTV